MFRMIMTTDDDAWKLTTRTEETEWTPEIRELANEVIRCLRINNPGMAALAANQIDIRKRIIALPGRAIFNPISDADYDLSNPDLWFAWEGCYSIADVWALVGRPYHVTITGLNPENGEPLAWNLEGINARIALHELDHIDGILMTDRATQTRPKDGPSNFISD